MSCVTSFGLPSSLVSERLRNTRCFDPKCIPGAQRSDRWVLMRHSASTPTDSPGFQLSTSHSMVCVVWVPSVAVTTCGPTLTNSMSCMWTPTWIPKCNGRKSMYGLFCNMRSCAVTEAATAQTTRVESSLFMLLNNAFPAVIVCTALF